MLVVVNKSSHEEHSSQPLTDKKKQFKITVTIYVDIMILSMVQTKTINSISYQYLEELETA